MYERFTDRSRRVMQLANQEAQRLNHEYIDTGHILIGMAKEGSGVAASVLKNLGVSLDMVLVAVRNLLTPGPDVVTMGKLPQTPRAKKVIEYTIDAARQLGHNYVGTEHLLLGLLRESEGLAASVLTGLGVTAEDVIKERELLFKEKDMPEGQRIPPQGGSSSAPVQVKFVKHIEATWSMPNGAAKFSCPADMAVEDISDLEVWFGLLLRTIKRANVHKG